MPDDEHESDDLFEDLDKFFAPIKDVEWDEPEEAAPSAAAPGGGARHRPGRARTRGHGATRG